MRAVVLVVLAIAACNGAAAAPPPKPAAPAAQLDPNSCKTAADCTLVTISSACCSTCGPYALGKTAASRLAATCKKGPPKHCPDLDCAYTQASAACVDGLCTTVAFEPGL